MKRIALRKTEGNEELKGIFSLEKDADELLEKLQKQYKKGN